MPTLMLRLGWAPGFPGARPFVIAATALSMGYELVTRDVRSFSKVPGLRVARW
jgi:predicted nucleic acid-binding protein